MLPSAVYCAVQEYQQYVQELKQAYPSIWVRAVITHGAAPAAADSVEACRSTPQGR